MFYSTGADAENIHVHQTSNIAFVTQTTLSLDETAQIIDTLKSRFPEISGPKNDDICYATQNRQDAVKQLALENEIIVVVGSKNSSNSNRLKELAESCGTKAYLIDEFKDLKHDFGGFLKDIYSEQKSIQNKFDKLF